MIYAVIGSASNFWEDYKRFRGFKVPHEVIVLNMQGVTFPKPYKYWLAMDPDRWNQLSVVLRRDRWAKDFEYVTPKRLAGVDHKWSCSNTEMHGGSAAYAICYVGHVLKGKAVLCGCPFDNSGKYYAPFPMRHGETMWECFKHGHASRPKVARSMSGKTKDLLGYPTKEWLECPQ